MKNGAIALAFVFALGMGCNSKDDEAVRPQEDPVVKLTGWRQALTKDSCTKIDAITSKQITLFKDDSYLEYTITLFRDSTCGVKDFDITTTANYKLENVPTNDGDETDPQASALATGKVMLAKLKIQKIYFTAYHEQRAGWARDDFSLPQVVQDARIDVSGKDMGIGDSGQLSKPGDTEYLLFYASSKSILQIGQSPTRYRYSPGSGSPTPSGVEPDWIQLQK